MGDDEIKGTAGCRVGEGRAWKEWNRELITGGPEKSRGRGSGRRRVSEPFGSGSGRSGIWLGGEGRGGWRREKPMRR